MKAAVAAVAEHSIMRQYGAGRPDEEDREELMAFGEKSARRFLKNRRNESAGTWK